MNTQPTGRQPALYLPTEDGAGSRLLHLCLTEIDRYEVLQAFLDSMLERYERSEVDSEYWPRIVYPKTLDEGSYIDLTTNQEFEADDEDTLGIDDLCDALEDWTIASCDE